MSYPEKGRRRPQNRGQTTRSEYISFKTTPQFKAALQTAAEENNATLSGEIERRLERSLEPGGGYLRGAGKLPGGIIYSQESGEELHMNMIGMALAVAETKTGKKWTQDKATLALAKDLVSGAMDAVCMMEKSAPAAASAKKGKGKKT